MRFPFRDGSVPLFKLVQLVKLVQLLQFPRRFGSELLLAISFALTSLVLTPFAFGQSGQTINVANGDVAGLIAAIQTLNGNAGGTINLASGGTYTVTGPSDWWYGPNAFPAISSAITINGNGATIQGAYGSPKFRFFFVSGGISTQPQGSLVLSNLTLTGGSAHGGNGPSGYAAGGGGAGFGGAIYNQGYLLVENVTFTQDEALGGSGGGAQNATVGGYAGGGGLGGNGGTSVEGPGGGGGFKGNGATGGVPGPAGGSFVASEGGHGTGSATSPYGGSGGATNAVYVQCRKAGGGGGGYAPGENGQESTASSGFPFDSPLGGAGAYGAGKGGDSVYASDDGLADCGGGGAFGGGGCGADFGGGGGGGIGGGGGGGYQNGGFGGFGGGGGGGCGGAGGFGGGGGGCGGGGGQAGGGGFGAGGGSGQLGGGGAGMGGAIFNHLGTVAIYFSSFYLNSAVGGGGSGTADGFGGAILNLGGTVTVSNTTYSLNSATNSQGAADSGPFIYNLAHNGGNTTSTQNSTATLNLIAVSLASGSDVFNNQVSGTATVQTSGSAPYAALSATSINFGNVYLDEPPPTQTVTMTNIGNAPLTISSVVLSTTSLSVLIDTCTGVTLAAGASCQETITVPTGSLGTVTGKLQFNDNSYTGGIQIVLLGATISSETTTKLAFGAAPAASVWTGGNGGDAVTVIEENSAGIQNYTGTDAITLTVSGPGGYNQSYTSTAVGGVATFNVSGTPLTGAGSYTYTASSGSLATATSSETVTAPNVGTASGPYPVTAVFTAAGTLNSIQVLTGGVSNLDYALSSGGTCATGTAYAVGQSCTVNVTFTPQSAGNRMGAAVLTDASGNVLGTARFSGIAQGAQITYSSIGSSGIGGGWNLPSNIAVDASGSVYVVDSQNNRVVKVPYSGGVSGTFGSPVTIASGGNPNGVAVDGAGNVFYTNSSTVVELPFNGTSYGAAINIPSQLSPGWADPTGIAVDGAGNLFVLDYGNGQVVEVPWTGTGYGLGIVVGPSSDFSFPLGLAIDSSDNVYVADGSYNTIVQLTNSAGGYGGPNYLGGGFVQVTNVAVDATGNVYAEDPAGGTISRIPWTGSGWGGQTTLLNVGSTNGIAVDSLGNIYVTAGFSQVSKFTVTNPPAFNFSTATNVGTTDTTDGPQTVSLFNIGNQPLEFTAPSTGANPSYPANFPTNTADGSLCTSGAAVAEAASCDVSVNFAPTVAGTNSGSVVLTDNALGVAIGGVSAGTQSIVLSGTGIGPQLVLSPASLTFNSTRVGSTAAYQVVTLTNSGSVAVVVSSIAPSGTNASSFSIPSNHQGCKTVAAGASCTFDVAFTPAAEGTLTASILVAYNASGSPQSVAVSGTGAAALASFSPASLTFNNTNVGSTAAYQVVTLTNTGNTSLVVSSIAPGGTNASSFSIPSAHQGCKTVTAGASCTFDVAFTPAAEGSLTASILVTDSATGSPQSVAVSGTGVAALASFSPASLTFSNTSVGSTAAYQVVTLTNAGNASLSVSSIAPSGTNASSFSIPSAHQGCKTVAAGASCTFDVAFTPAAEGTLTASILVTDNASKSPQGITVSGTGLAALASLSPSSLTFNSTTVGSTAAYQVVTLTNTGNKSLVVSSIAPSGTNASSFSIPSNHQGCTTVAAGASCTFDVAFKPTAKGSLTATILVTDNVIGSPQSIAVSGTGK